MKTCFKCGVSKSLDDFYKHPQMADGHLGKCKSCTKADRASYRNANPETVRESKREYAKMPRILAEKRAYQKTHPEKHLAASRRYAAKYPERYAARIAVGVAVRNGQLTKQPCEVCGNPKAEAHHDDYTKPLEVRWFCNQHHKAADAERRLKDG